ncbi:IARS [Mytilus coruscus]|uniref:IARS n=1 Tax=Mytilus coruscus TaxID=42192 RepID=A0A6J8DBG5_MYTCO|nr:IARS [Mytilus coruscus]
MKLFDITIYGRRCSNNRNRSMAVPQNFESFVHDCEVLFQDYVSLALILQEDRKKQNVLGRQIVGFNEDQWSKHRPVSRLCIPGTDFTRRQKETECLRSTDCWFQRRSVEQTPLINSDDVTKLMEDDVINNMMADAGISPVSRLCIPGTDFTRRQKETECLRSTDCWFQRRSVEQTPLINSDDVTKLMEDDVINNMMADAGISPVSRLCIPGTDFTRRQKETECLRSTDCWFQRRSVEPTPLINSDDVTKLMEDDVINNMMADAGISPVSRLCIPGTDFTRRQKETECLRSTDCWFQRRSVEPTPLINSDDVTKLMEDDVINNMMADAGISPVSRLCIPGTDFTRRQKETECLRSTDCWFQRRSVEPTPLINSDDVTKLMEDDVINNMMADAGISPVSRLCIPGTDFTRRQKETECLRSTDCWFQRRSVEPTPLINSDDVTKLMEDDVINNMMADAGISPLSRLCIPGTDFTRRQKETECLRSTDCWFQRRSVEQTPVHSHFEGPLPPVSRLCIPGTDFTRRQKETECLRSTDCWFQRRSVEPTPLINSDDVTKLMEDDVINNMMADAGISYTLNENTKNSIIKGLIMHGSTVTKKKTFLFQDYVSLALILQEDRKKQNVLGRQIVGFNEDQWSQHRPVSRLCIPGTDFTRRQKETECLRSTDCWFQRRSVEPTPLINSDDVTKLMEDDVINNMMADAGISRGSNNRNRSMAVPQNFESFVHDCEVLFQDYVSLALILQEDRKKQNVLGRQIVGFNEDQWSQHRPVSRLCIPGTDFTRRQKETECLRSTDCWFQRRSVEPTPLINSDDVTKLMEDDVINNMMADAGISPVSRLCIPGTDFTRRQKETECLRSTDCWFQRRSVEPTPLINSDDVTKLMEDDVINNMMADAGISPLSRLCIPGTDFTRRQKETECLRSTDCWFQRRSVEPTPLINSDDVTKLMEDDVINNMMADAGISYTLNENTKNSIIKGLIMHGSTVTKKKHV